MNSLLIIINMLIKENHKLKLFYVNVELCYAEIIHKKNIVVILCWKYKLRWKWCANVCSVEVSYQTK